MTLAKPEIRAHLLAALQSIAPELDVSTLSDAELLRNQVDLDSYDWLQFLLEVHRRCGIEIPESDYARLATLEQLIAYVQVQQR